MFNSYTDESRRNWGCVDREPSADELRLGCLQRIADASEAMAKEYNRLLADAKWQREVKECLQRDNDRLVHSNAALRGIIKRMKKDTNHD